MIADIFVGSVSIILGLVFIISAALNWSWSFQLAKANWLEEKFGRTIVRGVFFAIGIGLIALGAFIIL